MKIGQFGGKFLPYTRGHLWAAKEALSYVDKLYIILFWNEKFDLELCERDRCKPMPKDLRRAWIANSIVWLRQFGEVELLEIEYDEMEYDWAKGSTQVKQLIPDLTHVFSSEPEYDGFFKANYPHCTHIVLDADRSHVSISATQVRQDPFKYWAFMTEPVRKHFVKKICVTGTESTGKSTLVEMLKDKFNGIGIQEVGREWCIKYDNELTIDMFHEIAIKNQYLQNEALETANKYLIVDTDAVVTQYYLHKYKQCTSNLLSKLIQWQDFDIYLYCKPNVPWVQDQWGHRFLQDNRNSLDAELLAMYRDSLGRQIMYDKFRYIDADNWKGRLEQAVKLI
jgi:HTH-type transcriptional repressor of NAD biosynthesis genes